MFRIDVASAAAALPAPAAAGAPGYFSNGNPATSVPSTIVDQDWLNSVQEELVAIAVSQGAALSKTTRNQCLVAIQAMVATGASASAIQSQAPNYCAAPTGTGNAIVAAFTPVIAAHIAGAPLRVKIAANNGTGGVTFNPGPGAVAVKAPDASALQPNALRAGAIVTFVYDGAAYIFQEDTAAFMALSAGSWFASNLLIQQNATTPASQVDVSVDQITMMNASGLCRTFQNLSATINAALNGALNRLDVGALAANTGYDVWAIAKPDGTLPGFILSLASNTTNNFMGATTNSNLPAGYAGGFYMRLGTVQTNATPAFRRSIQAGREVASIVAGVTTGYPQVIAFAGANGNPATGPTVTTNVRADSGIAGAMVPAKCKRIKLMLVFAAISNPCTVIAAPTAAYGGQDSLVNAPPLRWTTNSTSQTNGNTQIDMQLEANSVAYANVAAAAGNCALVIPGWTEPVNAC